MKNRGFTLIELLSTLVILGILATIVITFSVRKINETKKEARDKMIITIELAAKEYCLEKSNEINSLKNYDYAFITLNTLIENEKFTNSLVDQTTKKTLPVTDIVYVVRNSNGTLESTYDINQKKHSKLVLNGSYNEYIKKDETYVEQGVTATSSSGSDVTNSVTITGSVDTSTVGNYKITYSHGNTTITRNVIVYE